MQALERDLMLSVLPSPTRDCMLLIYYICGNKKYDSSAHAGPRITVPRSLRWAACGAVSVSSTTALLVRLFSPECEPQNIAAYDKGS